MVAAEVHCHLWKDFMDQKIIIYNLDMQERPVALELVWIFAESSFLTYVEDSTSKMKFWMILTLMKIMYLSLLLLMEVI